MRRSESDWVAISIQKFPALSIDSLTLRLFIKSFIKTYVGHLFLASHISFGIEFSAEWRRCLLAPMESKIQARPCHVFGKGHFSFFDMNEQQIERVRRICLTLPETWEKISHGEPTWFVGKKVFAMFSNNHHNDGHVAVTLPAAIGIQEMLIKKSPKKFYRPPYVGVRGWIGIELERVSDRELALHIKEAWKLISPEKLHHALENPGR